MFYHILLFGAHDVDNLGKTAQLRQLLFGLEKDLGISELGTVKQNILYAATLVAKPDAPIDTDDIRRHELVNGVPRSTFFKALKELVAAGFLQHSDGTQRASYMLTDKVK